MPLSASPPTSASPKQLDIICDAFPFDEIISNRKDLLGQLIEALTPYLLALQEDVRKLQADPGGTAAVQYQRAVGFATRKSQVRGLCKYLELLLALREQQ